MARRADKMLQGIRRPQLVDAPNQLKNQVISASKQGQLTRLVWTLVAKRQRLGSGAASLILYRDSFSTSPLSDALLGYVASEIAAADGVNARAVGSALYGLRHREDSQGVRRVLTAVARQLRSAEFEMDGQGVGLSLYGLQGLACTAAGHALLAALIPKVYECQEPLSAHSLGSAAIGIAKMGEAPGVRQALAALTVHVGRAECRLSGTAVASLLYSVGSAATTPEGLGALQSICRLLQRGADPLSVEESATALYGLHALPDGLVARQLLHCVTPLISCNGEVVSAHVARATYGLHDKSAPAAEQVLAALAPWLTAATADGVEPQHISMTLYGVLAMVHRPVAQPIARLVSTWIRSCDALTGDDIAGLLYCLRYNSETAAFRQVVSAVTVHAWRCSWSPKSACGALFGLQGCRPSPAADALVEYLTFAVGGLKERFHPRHISMALFGMQNRSSDKVHLQLLAKFVPHIEAIDEAPTGLQCGNALYGLKGAVDSDEVRHLMGALCGFVEKSEGRFEAQSASCCVYGIGVQGDSPATRKMLVALAPRIATAELLTAACVGQILYGLRGHGSSAAVRQVLTAVHGNWQSVALGGVQLGMALYGMQGMKDVPESRLMIGMLRPSVLALPQTVRPKQFSSMMHGLLMVADGGSDVSDLVAAVLSRLPQRVSVFDSPAVAQVLSLVGVKPSATLQANAKAAPTSGSMKEAALQTLLNRSGVSGVTFNVAHESGFEMDVLTRGKVNVELDGTSLKYRTEGRMRLQQKRDKHLEEQWGIRVVRISTAHRGLSEVLDEFAEACGVEMPPRAGPWMRARKYAAHGWKAALRQHQMAEMAA